jgi:hypothetical protein
LPDSRVNSATPCLRKNSVTSSITGGWSRFVSSIQPEHLLARLSRLATFSYIQNPNPRSEPGTHIHMRLQRKIP